MDENSDTLSSKEVETLMLCLRGEYDSVEYRADELHDKLTSLGFSAFDNGVAAVITARDPA